MAASLNMTIKPSMAWLLVFVPAFSYFASTRLQSSGFRWGRSNTLGDPISTRLLVHDNNDNCQGLSQVFFLADSSCKAQQEQQEQELQYSLNLQATGRGMKGIVASIWKHDDELGRGYLLFSQSHGNGRIWRWEVGGGPIAIGRSLHLEDSGCRSGVYQPCHANQTTTTTTSSSSSTSVGSGGMAIDFHPAGTRHSEGSLVVAEWGEGRIIRMEDSNGARTPLMIQVPDACRPNNTTRRLFQPKSLLMNPYGDLLVADTQPDDCGLAAIYRLSQAVHVESLPSLTVSRKAHGWNQTHHSHPVDLIYSGSQEIGGMAMDPTWLSLYATVLEHDGRVLLKQMPAVTMEDDDDDETDDDLADDEEDDPDNNLPKDDEITAGDEEQPTTEAPPKPVLNDAANIVLDLTQALNCTQPGALTVSEKGHVFVAVPQGIAIISAKASVLGILPMPSQPTSLTLGEDQFLYAFSDDSLYRIRVRMGPVMVPTNLVTGGKR
ncbi:expressed unknown protein [Seminavis robusta]|uniref:Uncharacterized protein n=1 Tax=Seminavis robusta TaxID=568900 RepID=A0A9N8H9V1_9STRA|nr:expressed unknown protein [Seminavis robusta]|eukprot:Sro204_g085890.1 n/a (491) ;mRNA; r:39338-40810